MDNSYLIPANTKRSQLIFGFFNKVDLILFASGWILSLALILLIPIEGLLKVILLLPGIIVTFLVLPVPHYHNVLQLLTNILNFFINRRTYYWKGWCLYEEFDSDDRKQQ